MRALAVGVTTLFAFALAACADKEAVPKLGGGTTQVTEVAGAAEAKAVEEANTSKQGEPAGGEVLAGVASETIEEGREAVQDAASVAANDALDAKEATEAAARRIFDATRSAALKLKEAGREAVQSVRRDGADGTQNQAAEPAPAERPSGVSAGG